MPALGALLGKWQGTVIMQLLWRGAARAGGEKEEEGRKVWGVSVTPMHWVLEAQFNSPCHGKFESCLAGLCWSNLTEWRRSWARLPRLDILPCSISSSCLWVWGLWLFSISTVNLWPTSLGFPAGNLCLFQPIHSEVLPRRAWSLWSSFTNPHDRLLCRVILCSALSSGNKTLPEDRSPERALGLVPACRTQVGTIFCMEKLCLRGLRLSLWLEASSKDVQALVYYIFCVRCL